MKNFFFILIFLANFFAFSQSQKTQKKLSLESAVELALENNISILQEKNSLSALERQKKHSWSGISPSFSAGASLSVPNEKKSYDWQISVRAQAAITFTPSLFAEIKAAKNSYEAGELSFSQVQQSLEASVRKAFYALLCESENIVLQNQNLQSAKNRYEQNLERYKQGRISELDVLTSEVNYKSFLPQLESAQVSYENDLAQFKLLLGLELDEEIFLDGSLDELFFLLDKKIELTNFDFENVPSVKNLLMQEKLAQIALSASRISSYSPSIQASWAYNPGWRGANGNSDSSGDSGALSVSATIPLDGLLPWSAASERIKKAKDQIENIELLLQNEKSSIKAQVQNSLRKIEQLKTSLRLASANVELSQKSYEMTEQAYLRGTKNFETLQIASDTLLKNRLAVKTEIFSLVCEILDLEKMLGLPFSTLWQNENF